MAKYVLGAVEIVAGIYFENPSLVAMGAATILGAALTPKPPTQYGPRLQDLKMQVSTYGKFIPITYGAMRIAGNVIWSTPKIETTHESGGGKGGGGPKQVDYTYAISFAVALCEGQIVGIRRIWANGKLIYNLGASADIGTVIASNSNASGFRVYTGTATQLPDSLIQSYVGINNCPAYRDTAYVVFENLQLADFYNQMPNLEFEVISSGTASQMVFQPQVLPVNQQWSDIAYGNGIYVAVSDNSNLCATSVDRKTWVQGTMPLNNRWTGVKFGNGVFVAVVRDSNISATSINGIVWVLRTVPYGGWESLSFLNGFFLALSSGASLSILSKDGVTWTQGTLPTVAQWNCLSYGNSVYVAASFGSSVAATSSDGVNWLPVNLPLSTGWRSITFGNGIFLLVGGQSNISLTSPDGAAWTQQTMPGNVNWRVALFGGGQFLAVAFADYTAATSSDCVVWTSRTMTSSDQWDAGLYQDGAFIIIAANSSVAEIVVLGTIVSSTTPQVSSIVSDLCTRAGLQQTDFDVSQLTDTCDGYTVTNLSTARAAIEPLMQAFYFNADESDGKIKFVKRGQQPQVIIPEDDLAAHSYGAQMPDQVLSVRSQELDLPSEITLDYMDKDADYIIGTQYSRRLTTSSKAVTTIQMAMSLSASKAKQITQVLLAEAWMARNNRNFTTTDKYSKYEPTDVVQIVKDGKSYTVRITNKDESNGICKFSAVDEDPTLYTQNAVAASLPPPIQTVAGASVTDLQLLDIPLLRDQDDGTGFYLSACSYAGTFGGTQVFKSSDNGASWNAYGAGVLNAGTIGSTSTALGNFLSGNIFDETNTVSVTLINGTLSSITELGVLNGGNYALIGSEIIQFKNATLTATNTYKLSGLLRGRQGTEWAMSGHVSGERFVLLSSTTVYIEQAPSNEYNIPRLYAGVAFGSYLSDAQQISFTNTAVSQKPYAPVLLGGGRDASGNITINWTRRGRIAGGWTDYSDIPLGEASQSYDVEIWDSTYTTLKRTFTALTTPTASYTSANQVTDFGSNQATVYTRVYQNSATVGRGYKLQGSI